MVSTRFLSGAAALVLGLALTMPGASFGAGFGGHGGGGGGVRMGGGPAMGAVGMRGGGGPAFAGGGPAYSGARVVGASPMNSFAAVRTGQVVNPGVVGAPRWNGGRATWNGNWNGGWHHPHRPFVPIIVGGGYGYYGPDYYYDYGPDYSYYDDGTYDDGTAVAVVPGADANWCAQTYRTYDPASGTYLGYDGQRHPCP
jgi:hypothetical protein